ncbi:S49 family peptidase [Vibrio fluvialis]|nr:S49 family peptidase [Vibrio fluvialis]ELL4670526.1 S49 family peptidase [Vibrio fluvialis]
MNYLDLKQILSKPVLSTPELYQTAIDVLTDKELRKQYAAADNSLFKTNNMVLDKLEQINGVEVLNIEGALTYKSTGLNMLCGGTSYQGLQADFEKYASQGIKKVVLLADSSGGESFGCFSTAKAIKNLAIKNNMKLIGFVDGIAASACYALMSICDEIYATEDSQVGSIGVVCRLMNDSQKLKNEGLERTFVYAGKSKIPFTPDGSFSESFIADLQASVDETYNTFVNHVTEYRKLSVEAVKNTEAKIFNTTKAKDLGLITGIKTVSEFLTYLQAGATFNNPTPTTQTKATIDPAHMARVKAALDKTEQPQLTAEDHKQKLQNSVKWFYENRMKDK